MAVRGPSGGPFHSRERDYELHVFHGRVGRYRRMCETLHRAIATGPEIEILREGMRQNCRTAALSPTDPWRSRMSKLCARIEGGGTVLKEKNPSSPTRPSVVSATFHALLLLPYRAFIHCLMFITCLLLFIYSHRARRIVCKSTRIILYNT